MTVSAIQGRQHDGRRDGYPIPASVRALRIYAFIAAVGLLLYILTGAAFDVQQSNQVTFKKIETMKTPAPIQRPASTPNPGEPEVP